MSTFFIFILKYALATARQILEFGVRMISFFFYLGFLSRRFTNHRTAGEGGGHFFNSSLPLPPASQTLRHQPGDYCRELTSTHSQQSGSSREPLVSERKSLTTKLREQVQRRVLKALADETMDSHSCIYLSLNYHSAFFFFVKT